MRPLGRVAGPGSSSCCDTEDLRLGHGPDEQPQMPLLSWWRLSGAATYLCATSGVSLHKPRNKVEGTVDVLAHAFLVTDYGPFAVST